MIELLNPWLLGGLTAVSVPVILHLLHRRKVKIVDWGAMRFLVELLARSRRRLFLNELLLLLVRALVIACLALAMARPAWHRSRGDAGGKGLLRQGRAAAVLLVDDSVSSAAGRAQPAFESLKKLGLAYLDSLAPGDEVSVIPMSQLGAPISDPVFDLDSVKTSLGGLRSSSAATDIPALLEAGLAQLKRHVNPGAELVVLTDGRKDGWRETDRGRWEDLRLRLRGPKNAIPGSRQRPHVLVLAPRCATIDDNLAIVAMGTDQTLLTPGQPAGVRVRVGNYGKQGTRETTIQLRLNGQAAESKRIEVPMGGEQEAVFTLSFPAPGSYGLEASLVNNQDLLPADDRRATSVQVESGVPVLLVEDSPAPGLESKLGFLAVALHPAPDGAGAFQVTRLPTARLSPAALQGFRLVVLGDVPVLEQAMVDALEQFVVGGGGVLAGLGPDSDPAFVNRHWSRGGEGFLPCPLGAVATPPRPALPATISLGHPAFNGFGARNDEAWKAARVRSWFRLQTQAAKAGGLDVLVRLDNGDPLVVECRRGLGLVDLVATSLNADWTDLPLQAAYVPLMRGLAGHLGSFVMPPRNLQPGSPLIYARIADRKAARRTTGTDPAGNPIKLTLGAWEGRDAIMSEALTAPGLYTLRDGGTGDLVRYAVALAPEESRLAPLSDRDISLAFPDGAQAVHSPEEAGEILDPARRQSAELWKWLVGGAVLLMFAEAAITRRDSAGGGVRNAA